MDTMSLLQKARAENNLRDLMVATGLVIVLKLVKIVDFQPVWPRNLLGDIEK